MTYWLFIVLLVVSFFYFLLLFPSSVPIFVLRRLSLFYDNIHSLAGAVTDSFTEKQHTRFSGISSNVYYCLYSEFNPYVTLHSAAEVV